MSQARFIQILVLLSAAAHSPEASSEPQVVLIGTMHQNGEHFSDDDLFRVLLALKPDVVLLERDSSMLTKEHWYLATANPGLEERAVRKLRGKHTFVTRPYEYEGRRAYKDQHAFKANNRAMSAAIEKMRTAGQLSELHRAELSLYDAITQTMMTLGNEPLRIFNAPAASALVELKKNTQYRLKMELATHYPQLSEFKEHWGRVVDFWHLRNQTMASNIVSWAEEYNDSRIVVLSGFSHKYYLMDELKDESSIELIEYWELLPTQR